MTTARLLASIAAALSAGMLFTACGRHDAGEAADSTAATATGDVALPKPQAKGGSVTGMPSKPGPNPVGPASVAQAEDADADAEQDGIAVQSGDEQLDAGDATDDAGVAIDEDSASGAPVDEPSVQDAIAVLRDYYAAINRQDYQRAWSSWSDGGRSSGQTPQQFADGFAGTAQVALQAGAPGPIGAAAGSRYIEIPVTIDATQRDGSVRRYTGTYTLRRAVVDGATDAQRAWHIASASLHPTGP